MRLHRIPAELIGLALFAFLFSSLTIAFQLFRNEFRWWAIRWDQFRMPFLVALGAGFVFTGLLLRFPTWARRWLFVCAFTWFVYCFIEVQKSPFTSLILFFVLSHAVLWFLYREITQYLRLPQIHLGSSWFHGPADWAPSLSAEMLDAGKVAPMRVSALSLDGVALFTERPLTELPFGDDLRVRLRFRGKDIVVPSELVTSLLDKKGLRGTLVGLKFKVPNLDEAKEFSDFLERMRGEGHEC